MEQNILNSLLPQGTFNSMSKGELGYYLLTFTNLPKEIAIAIRNPDTDIEQIRERGLCVKCGKIGNGISKGKTHCSPDCEDVN